MWKVLSGVLAALGGVVMAAAGVSPGDAASNISKWLDLVGLKNAGAWTAGSGVDDWALVAGAVTALLGIAGIVLTNMRSDAQLQAPQKPDDFPGPNWRLAGWKDATGRTHLFEEDARKATVARDVWLLDAAKYFIRRDWEQNEPIDMSAELQRLYDAFKEFQQAALDGDLPIWGQTGFSGPFVEIPTSYWVDHGFEWTTFLKDGPEETMTEAKTTFRSSGVYRALKTSKVATEKLWPKANT